MNWKDKYLKLKKTSDKEIVELNVKIQQLKDKIEFLETNNFLLEKELNDITNQITGYQF